ncbi:MAG: Branched-chain-amino-acid aminotransferase [Pseudomonadota bacterium]|jgi:branched-chain amino acid aminotransferase
MEPTQWIWMNGSFIPWNDARVHVLSHGLHYGSSIFEGIRAYKTERGTAIFRLKEHMDRFHYSAQAIQMKIPYSAPELSAITVELLKRNKIEACYIRPHATFGYGVMGLNPAAAPVDISIACWSWGAYLPISSANIKVSKYIRIHPSSTVADAKIGGHYVNSILAVQEVQGTSYHEALFLDYQGYIAEGPGANFFIIKDRKLYTPPLGAILPGITRASVLEIARDKGLSVTEKNITVEEAQDADEAFFTGTAAEMTPIGSIEDKPLRFGAPGPLTAELKQAYLDAAYGRAPRYDKFLTFVS